ncbi:MAG: hypothetical protein JRJ27_22205 [Deltaproteobacteria bacterium]|nr:hypothetical protein [Deltaproteobacteria bacterium]
MRPKKYDSAIEVRHLFGGMGDFEGFMGVDIVLSFALFQNVKIGKMVYRLLL